MGKASSNGAMPRLHLTGGASSTTLALENLILADSNIWEVNNENLPALGPTFQSLAQYSATLTALVLEEAKESVRSGFHDNAGELQQVLSIALKHWPASARVLNVQLRQVNESANSVVCSIETDKISDREWLLQNTIVLLTRDVEHVKRRQKLNSLHVIGLISCSNFNQKESTITIQMASYNRSFFNTSTTMGDSSSALTRRTCDSSIWLVPCTKLSTFSQEYAALQSLDVLDKRLLHCILEPGVFSHRRNESTSTVHDDQQTLACYCPSLNALFNADQQRAIDATVVEGYALQDDKESKTSPFTLIQGPPGTGKTHTIWGLLNALHLFKFEEYYKSIIGVINGSSKHKLSRPHLLVCAPSNGAVFNILERVVKSGFMQRDGKKYKPSIAHVGVKTSVEFSVELKARSLLNMSREDWLLWFSRQFHTVKVLENEIQLHLHSLSAESALHTETSRESTISTVLSMYENRDRAVADLSRLEHLRSYYEGKCTDESSLDELQSRLEASIVDEAEIVFTTLASSGKRCLMKISHGFNTVIVDEAAQSTESCLLLPLFHGVKHCVLVGDPKQLPSTVLSKLVAKSNFDRSLFERLVENGIAPYFLSMQYRMHPAIRHFPSNFFYAGKLIDGEAYHDGKFEREIESLYCPGFESLGPYLIFDTIDGTEEKNERGSVKNDFEALLCMRLLLAVDTWLARSEGPCLGVTIITPYTFQCEALSRMVRELQVSKLTIAFSTIDGFQGRESDIVIFSCVRNSLSGMGFMTDARRLNVALTRAKSILWILCSSRAISDSTFGELFRDACARNVLVSKAAVKGIMTQNMDPRSTILHETATNCTPKVP